VLAGSSLLDTGVGAKGHGRSPSGAAPWVCYGGVYEKNKDVEGSRRWDAARALRLAALGAQHVALFRRDLA